MKGHLEWQLASPYANKALDKRTVITVYSVQTEMTVISAYRDAAPGVAKTSARIVLAGGSGQVGTLLARRFLERGDDVCVLARTTYSAPWRVLAWDGQHLGEWVRQLESADVVINLAGRSVNCRYHRWNRREILESRVQSTQLIGEAIRRLKNPPRVWLNASTATIYRHALDKPMDEETGELGGGEAGAPRKWSFSIEVAKRWEEALFAIETSGTRKIAMRSAMIMSADRGGIFDVLSRLTRFGLGGKTGSGEQFVSWIHEKDFVRALDFLIEDETIAGAVNVTSPNPLPNAEFMRALRDAWGARFGLSSGGCLLEFGTFLLRTESELILKSRRVVPSRLLQRGFRFHFWEWPAAAVDLVQEWRRRNHG